MMEQAFLIEAWRSSHSGSCWDTATRTIEFFDKAILALEKVRKKVSKKLGMHRGIRKAGLTIYFMQVSQLYLKATCATHGE